MNLENRSQPIKEIQGIKLPFRLVEFMKFRMWGYLASVVIIAVSLFFVFTKGFNWGLDFTGGVVVDTHFPNLRIWKKYVLPLLKTVSKAHSYKPPVAYVMS